MRKTSFLSENGHGRGARRKDLSLYPRRELCRGSDAADFMPNDWLKPPVSPSSMFWTRASTSRNKVNDHGGPRAPRSYGICRIIAIWIVPDEESGDRGLCVTRAEGGT